jgi:DNA-directed RNA polymerase subunit RPC12/RpoP
VQNAAYTATRFGGRRQWLTCLKCGRRCRKIYGGRYFRCRQCHGLVHASTREPAYQRALDRAEGMRKRLGAEWGSAFEGAPLPPKPPRMRWVTYRRLEAQYEEQQNRWAWASRDASVSWRDRLSPLAIGLAPPCKDRRHREFRFDDRQSVSHATAPPPCPRRELP